MKNMSRCLQNLERIEGPSAQILRNTDFGTLFTKIRVADYVPGDSVHSFRRRVLELAGKWHVESYLDTLSAALPKQTVHCISDKIPITQEEQLELTHDQPQCPNNTDVNPANQQETGECIEASNDNKKETLAKLQAVDPGVTTPLADEDKTCFVSNRVVIDLTEDIALATPPPDISRDHPVKDSVETSPNSIEPVLGCNEGKAACEQGSYQD